MIKSVYLFIVSIFLITNCSHMKAPPTDNHKEKIAPMAVTNVNITNPIEMKTSTVNEIKEWSGESGDTHFYWNGKDLFSRTKGGKEKKIFSKFSNIQYEEYKEEDVNGCLISYYYRPLSIVGNMVSFEFESGILCGAIVSGNWNYRTFELGKDGQFLSYQSNNEALKSKEEPYFIGITDIFPEEEIFKAFLANENILEGISEIKSEGKLAKAPENLTDLNKLFERFESNFFGGKFYLTEGFLESFAINQIEEEKKVSVWISLMPKTPAERALREHIKLILPIPERWEKPLRLADSLQEGFLMKDSKKLLGTEHAEFKFDNLSKKKTK